MQITHNTNGKGLLLYPDDVKVAPVNVYMHDSGMFATHDYSCPCCREESAILDLSSGLMKPCWKCGKDYELKKIDKRSWWEKILS